MLSMGRAELNLFVISFKLSFGGMWECLSGDVKILRVGSDVV
jgi:hypothetical protein